MRTISSTYLLRENTNVSRSQFNRHLRDQATTSKESKPPPSQPLNATMNTVRGAGIQSYYVQNRKKQGLRK